MLRERDIDEAIAECVGEKNPTARTCAKLASYLTIKKEMFGAKPSPAKRETPSYSYAAYPGKTIWYSSHTDFSRAIRGKNDAEIWPIIDDLMSTLQIEYPLLYDGIMRKLD